MLKEHMPVLVEGLEEFNPIPVDQLDERLQKRIRLTKPLTMEERVKFARMNASIFPRYLKSAASAKAAAAACAADNSPPLTNRGGKTEWATEYNDLPSVKALEKYQFIALGRAGKYTAVMVPLPDKDVNPHHAFIDWVNFTFKSHALPLELNTGHPAVDDDDYIHCLSARLFDVFGYGVCGRLEHGQNFYTHTWNLGIQNWGTVSIGGQHDSVLVTVKGQGLMAAKPGWELRLYRFLRSITGAKLTRVDYAADNFDSETSLDDYLQLYHAGMFSLRGFPKVRQDGNWQKPDGKGRTLYLGSKESGKLLRIYEKGLQLANGFHEQYPNWVRVELELGAKDRVIPLDSLLRPGQYLAGAYPALAKFHHVQKRVETFKNTAKSTVARSLETTRHQFGKHIWLHCQLHGADEAIKLLTHGKEELPKNINFDDYRALLPENFVHNEKPLVFDGGEIPLNILSTKTEG